LNLNIVRFRGSNGSLFDKLTVLLQLDKPRQIGIRRRDQTQRTDYLLGFNKMNFSKKFILLNPNR
jgi:hypothetical protein